MIKVIKTKNKVNNKSNKKINNNKVINQVKKALIKLKI